MSEAPANPNGDAVMDDVPAEQSQHHTQMQEYNPSREDALMNAILSGSSTSQASSLSTTQLNDILSHLTEDERRNYNSIQPFLTPNIGPSNENIDAETRAFMREHGITTQAELQAKIASMMKTALVDTKQRAQARQEAIEKNKAIDKQLEQMDATRELERSIVAKEMKKKLDRRRERAEREATYAEKAAQARRRAAAAEHLANAREQLVAKLGFAKSSAGAGVVENDEPEEDLVEHEEPEQDFVENEEPERKRKDSGHPSEPDGGAEELEEGEILE